MTATPSSVDLLTRREALRRASPLLGGAALIGESAWPAGNAGAAPESSSPLFSANEIALLGEIADTILPATSTPGAKATGVGSFIAVMVADVYDAGQQKTFATA
jgi:hypothetical protein